MSEPSNVAKYGLICLAVSGCIALEHIGRLKNLPIKPSIPFQFMHDKLKILFSWIGEHFAKISSFLSLIDLTELKQTIYDIVSPICGIVVSPLYTVEGYINALVNYKPRWQVYLGSISICAIVTIGLYYFNKGKYFDGLKGYVSKMISN
uniref:Uncharacterized protein n=1 Tax=viral metagenome TaxID=1070528 RepID=A0A6C0C883_9ZZZZ